MDGWYVATICSGLNTAFALYIKQQQLLFYLLISLLVYLLKTSVLVYLHSVREIEPFCKWGLLDDERCTCPVSPSELVNVDGSLETFDDYRHIAYISSTISSKLFFLISMETRLAMSNTFVSGLPSMPLSWI